MILGKSELAVLACLFNEERDGLGIAHATDFSISKVYMILHNLERRGLVTSHWGETTAERLARRGGNRVRVYKITEEGKKANL